MLGTIEGQFVFELLGLPNQQTFGKSYSELGPCTIVEQPLGLSFPGKVRTCSCLHLVLVKTKRTD